jgi:hypothetical protein
MALLEETREERIAKGRKRKVDMYVWLRIRKFRGEMVTCQGTVGLWWDTVRSLTEFFEKSTDIDKLKVANGWDGMTVNMTEEQHSKILLVIMESLEWTNELRDKYPEEFEKTLESCRELIYNAMDEYSSRTREAAREERMANRAAVKS